MGIVGLKINKGLIQEIRIKKITHLGYIIAVVVLFFLSFYLYNKVHVLEEINQNLEKSLEIKKGFCPSILDKKRNQ